MWKAPIILAVSTMIGLVAALTGEGWRDVCAWLGLMAPIAAVMWAMLRRQ